MFALRRSPSLVRGVVPSTAVFRRRMSLIASNKLTSTYVTLYSAPDIHSGGHGTKSCGCRVLCSSAYRQQDYLRILNFNSGRRNRVQGQRNERLRLSAVPSSFIYRCPLTLTESVEVI